MEPITEPGTIDQLVTDATSRGHRASARLVRDWTELGLLDYPHHRPAGKGHGSRPALYSANQRNLFLTLLHHRPTNKIKSLARIPVGIWMYWGDEYVPTLQAKRALQTWLGDPRASRRQAHQVAQEVVRQLDNPSATASARRRLLGALTEIAYTGRADYDTLTHAVREVFEPGASAIRKAVGHPGAPLMAESLVALTRARLEAIARLTAGEVTDDELQQARHAHLVAYAEYAVQQPAYAAHAPAAVPNMYEPATAESALVNVCGHLLTVLGLNALNPDTAAQVATVPAPRITFYQV